MVLSGGFVVLKPICKRDILVRGEGVILDRMLRLLIKLCNVLFYH